MTEAEWLGSVDLMPMLEYLLSKASDRKLRLFAVECCRRVRAHLLDPRCLQAFESIEANTDKGRHDPSFLPAAANANAVCNERRFQVLTACVGEELTRRVYETSTRTLWGLTDDATAREAINKVESDPIYCAACAVYSAAGFGRPSDDVDYLVHIAEVTAVHAAGASGDYSTEMAAQVLIVRDIFGILPFRNLPFAPAWRTSTVVALADGIYQDRAFDRMPILADALEDAGCDNEDILDHCRGDGPHVRGCWVVDLVLSKN